MQAILHGKAKSHARGTPPKSVAAKYSSAGKDAPDQSGSNTGGTWGEKHHEKAKEKVKSARIDRKKQKAKLRKSLDEFYKGKGVGIIVEDGNGRILVGKQNNMGVWTTPGGHVEHSEAYDEAALRELREETGLVGSNPVEIGSHKLNGNDAKVFLVHSYKGKLGGSGELGNLKWIEPRDIPWDSMRDCAAEGLGQYLTGKLGKSKALKDMVAMEKLQKNIIRSGTDAVYELTHGDSLKLVGNGAFRWLRENTKGMKDEEFKDLHLDNYTISIRRHVSDVYSGRISDGHKVVHQFTNRSLPALTAEIMSVFEWYMPEDEPELDKLIADDIHDDAIEGGMNELVENYKRHNLANIYQEMENIRTEVRNGQAVDLQQVEARVMKLFDKLEDTIQEIVGKHNRLSQDSSDELDKLEAKLRDLQMRIDEIGKKPETVEAYSTNPAPANDVFDSGYFYLTRPSIEISPNGKIKITFGQDWNPLDKENFLGDMRAKVIKKASK
jgi:8-oxo-dGTP pyrophosphatase MutT (NUDIX family)